MADDTVAPSRRIDARIAELGDWRGALLARLRGIILAALPDAIEEWKWRGVPVWYSGGMICTGETYKAVVKLTFAKGAKLDDPACLFNASLDGNVRRAIDFREGDVVGRGGADGLAAGGGCGQRGEREKLTEKPRITRLVSRLFMTHIVRVASPGHVVSTSERR